MQDRQAMSADLNILAAWLGIAAGVVSGIGLGLFFHHDDFFGGYTTWPRRLLRLGHISFFGLAALNLAYAFTVVHLCWADYHWLPSVALIVTAITMPLVCFAAAFVRPARHLFAVPVGAALVGVIGTLMGGLAA